MDGSLTAPHPAVQNTCKSRSCSSLTADHTNSGPYFAARYILVCRQLFYSFFKTLVGKEIAVELKNDVALTGTLHSVDQYLNVKLTDVQVVDAERYPQLVSDEELGCLVL